MEGNSGSGDNWNTWGSNFQTGRVVPADPGTNIQDLCAEECSPGNRQDTAQDLQACRLLQAHRTGGDFLFLFFLLIIVCCLDQRQHTLTVTTILASDSSGGVLYTNVSNNVCRVDQPPFPSLSCS